MSKIALLPGGFKPPHAGHYNMAKWLLNNTDADFIIVKVGAKEREGITREISLRLWDLYTQDDDNIQVEASTSNSPVRDVYDFIEQEAPEGSTIYLGMGEKDINDQRFSNISKFAEPKGITFETKLVPPQAGGVSGTEMRGFIKNKDKESFQKFIPDHIDKDKAWNIVNPLEEESFSKDWWANQLSEVFSDNQATINGQLIPLEIMSSPEEQMRGMMGRDSLDGGMLFPYREAGERSFHMKDCLISLDIVFITQGEITNISPDCPPCLEDKCPQYTGLADNVLELPGNYCQQNNINIGDYIKFPEEEPYGDTTAYRDYAKSSEWKAGMPDGHKDDIPRKGDQIHNRQTAPVSWEESIKEDWQVGPQGKVLHAYDFDDTIASVETTIQATIPNGDIISIPSDVFPDASLELDDEHGRGNWTPDFSEFNKQIENAITNMGVVNKLKSSLSNPSIKTTILTARNIGHPVTRYLRKELGLEAYVVPLGLAVSGDRVTGKDKADWIENHINKGYNTIYFIDDSTENRTAVESLKDKYPDTKITIEDPSSLLETKYGAHDLISQYRDEIQSDYGHQQYRDLQLLVSQNKDEEAENWLKTKGYMNETRLFSKDWWLNLINEHIITEGGAAGHMAHPFNLSRVNSGKDLKDIFVKTANSLETTSGSVKIDGVNSSIRLVDLEGTKQSVMDRGSKKELDIKGITKDDLLNRFKPGHGMIKVGGEVLDMFNEALPSIQNDLITLGAWDNPNILFNMEYVSGKTNVQDYGSNFIAIHGLNKMETKEVQGKRGMLTKRFSTEFSYDNSALQSLLDNLTPVAKKRGFEVYGSVPTEMTNKPNFNAALSQNYTVEFTEGNKTQSLDKWLGELNNIPEEDFIFINIDGTSKKVGAVSKQVYLAILQGENVDDLFEDDRDKAIEGFITYLATEKLGDEVLKVLDSPMGSVEDHEGVVIRDKNITDEPFKITGKFILGGLATGFK